MTSNSFYENKYIQILGSTLATHLHYTCIELSNKKDTNDYFDNIKTFNLNLKNKVEILKEFTRRYCNTYDQYLGENDKKERNKKPDEKISNLLYSCLDNKIDKKLINKNKIEIFRKIIVNTISSLIINYFNKKNILQEHLSLEENKNKEKFLKEFRKKVVIAIVNNCNIINNELLYDNKNVNVISLEEYNRVCRLLDNNNNNNTNNEIIEENKLLKKQLEDNKNTIEILNKKIYFYEKNKLLDEKLEQNFNENKQLNEAISKNEKPKIEKHKIEKNKIQKPKIKVQKPKSESEKESESEEKINIQERIEQNIKDQESDDDQYVDDDPIYEDFSD